MAIKKQIEIVADSKQAEASLNDVVDILKDIQKQNVKNEKSFEDTTKALKGAEGATKLLAKGFRGAGLALKAMGIGLALEAFAILKDLFMSNQQVADFFGTAIKGLGIVFNDLFAFFSDNIPKVVDWFKEIFENPTESLKELGESIKNNLIERFTSAIEVAGFLSEALMKVFKGDFAGALDSVKEAGKEFVDVMTGIDGTTEIVAEGVTKLAGAVSEYAKETWNSAEALQAQENAAILAQATQEGLIEKYDRAAEKLRQVRDDETKSIADRIEANEELAKVLDEQEKAMKAEAAAQVQAAENQFRLNGSIENEAELIRARNNVKAVEAQIEGFRSEQLTNKVALEKELIDLSKARTQTETELAFKSKMFAIEQIENDRERLEAKRKLLEEERQDELNNLQNNINLYKEGTTARFEAEREYATRKLELDQEIYLIEKEQKEKQLADEVEFNNRLIQAEETLQNAKRSALEMGLGMLQQFAGKNKAIALAILGVQKGLAIADVIVGSSKAIASAKASMAPSPTNPPFLGPGVPNPAFLANLKIGAASILATKIGAAASIASIVAAGLSSAKSITAGSGGSTGASASGMGGAGTPPPAFNVVGTSGMNQIAEQLSQEQQPVQAFVVGSNVTTQQELDRNIVTTASLG